MNLDAGEIFLNFSLNVDVQPYCGVNLTGLPLEKGIVSRNRWNRSWIDYKPSPYNAVRHLSVAMEYAKVDPLDENNPFF